MRRVSIKTEEMHAFFAHFDPIRYRIFYEGNADGAELPLELQRRYSETALNEGWSIEGVTDAYRTLGKVYSMEEESSASYCNLLQSVFDSFLRDYIKIDGLQELFHSSYFYFEWMMHLEYMEQRYSYSYYRDHYLHQIRNLYEMLLMLDEMGLWRDCMDIYRKGNNSIGSRIREGIKEQVALMPQEEKKILGAEVWKGENLEQKLEEMEYHHLFAGVATVAALIHDIGYPIVYMKRTMTKLQQFLPLSNLFMNIENEIPRIKSVLSQSLLFQTVKGNEIERRLCENDHGTYSAVILLFHYYDNGAIFHLTPGDRLVIELSALVIYNHTLRYQFQDSGKYHRYQNVYTENPLSYLFRLCDDLQEWDRVYFDISKESNFFVCDRCKTPMMRNLNNKQNVKGKVGYRCYCNSCGINTNSFPYRKLINVAPFNELLLEREEDGKHINITLRCDLSALLQLCKYDPMFAVQRAKGIREVKDMLKGQRILPPIYVHSYVSNNPIAIKTRILRNFYEKEYPEEIEKITTKMKGIDTKQVWDCSDILEEIRQSNLQVRLWKGLVEERPEAQEGIDGEKIEQYKDWRGAPKRLFLESLKFYLLLVLLGEQVKVRRAEIYQDYIEKSAGNEAGLAGALKSYFGGIAAKVAIQCRIKNHTVRELIADNLTQSFCEITRKEFAEGKYTPLYYYYLSTHVDMVDKVTHYTGKDMYARICAGKSRQSKTGETLYDYYSDYFMFLEMDRRTT